MNGMNFTYTKTKAPCKDCPDRKVGCHSVCKKYLEWQQVHNTEMEAIKKERKFEFMNIERIRRVSGNTFKEN